MPRIFSDHHADAVVAVEDHDGTPVLIHEGGRYPRLVDDAGARITCLISVARYGATCVVHASAGYADDRLMTLHVGDTASTEEARQLYPAAKAAMDRAPGDYAEYRRLLTAVGAYGAIDREHYEREALRWGFAPLTDVDTNEWGEYHFPQYPLEDLPRLWLNQRRAFGFKREIEEAAKVSASARATTDADRISRTATQPVVDTITRLMPHGTPTAFVRGAHSHTVVRRVDHRIDEDSASIHGSHLLGHEGELGGLLTVEKRGIVPGRG